MRTRRCPLEGGDSCEDVDAAGDVDDDNGDGDAAVAEGEDDSAAREGFPIFEKCVVNPHYKPPSQTPSSSKVSSSTQTGREETLEMIKVARARMIEEMRK
jgi:hypothetical protein